MKYNYYINSFLWSTICKLLNAFLGFISIPMLIKHFGPDTYGVLGIAIASNAYMQLFDLGLNTGAIKFFSEWREKGALEQINRTAKSSLCIYLIFGFINALIFISIAIWGENLFNISHEQFLILRKLFLILSTLTILSWINTVFNQLLISAQLVSFTQKVTSWIIILKFILIYVTVHFNINVTTFYFIQSLLITSTIIPLSYKCIKVKLIDKIEFKFYWNDIKVILIYCLNIFLLSLLQMSATQTRPIILGIFAEDATQAITYYRTIEVFPLFLITIGTSLSNIFLPKASAAIGNDNITNIHKISISGTTICTVIACCLCFPVILNAKALLFLYMGTEYTHLSWLLQIWCIAVIMQIQSSPNYSLAISTGKTKILVLWTLVSSILSISINIVLCPKYGIISAILCYVGYVIINMAFNYIYYYKKLLHLSRQEMINSFLKPFSGAFIILTILLIFYPEDLSINSKLNGIFTIIIQSGLFIFTYLLIIHFFKIFNFKDLYKAILK